MIGGSRGGADIISSGLDRERHSERRQDVSRATESVVEWDA